MRRPRACAERPTTAVPVGNMLVSGGSVLCIKGVLPKTKLGVTKHGIALLQSRELIFGFYEKTDEILNGQPVYRQNVHTISMGIMLWYSKADNNWVVSWDNDYGKPTSGAGWVYSEQSGKWYMLTTSAGMQIKNTSYMIAASNISVHEYFSNEKDFDITDLKKEVNQTSAHRFMKAKTVEEQQFFDGLITQAIYDQACTTKRKAEQASTKAIIKELDDTSSKLKKARVDFDKAKQGAKSAIDSVC